MRRSAFLVTLALGLGAGCSRGHVPQMLVGPAREPPSHALFERIVAAVRASGYRAGLLDPEQGSFAVRVRYRDISGGYRILVQCYRDGHVELRPAGRGVTPRGDELLVPLRVRREMVEVGETIRRALRRGA